MKHFYNYPKIDYQGTIVTDISLRAKIRDSIKSKNFLYYQHVIHDDERADIIASKYYGNAGYTWAIFYANDIFDPIEQWPLSTEVFYSMLRKRYGSIEIAQETTHHYMLDDEIEIDFTTYMDTNIEAFRKKLVSVYDYEFQINENKRNIKIIDSAYVKQITNELSKIFK